MSSKKPNDNRVLPEGIYGITAEKFSRGRSNLEVVRRLIDGGVKMIQYREKRPHKSFAEMLAECRQIRALTQAHGVSFIVNDYVDIALLSDADGVHGSSGYRKWMQQVSLPSNALPERQDASYRP